jgi:hypothetical protein
MSQQINNLISGIFSVKSIDPPSGSIYGNTLVTINGNGFSKNDLVYLDNSKCKIVNFTINEIKCLTSPHSEQQVSLTIKYQLIISYLLDYNIKN